MHLLRWRVKLVAPTAGSFTTFPQGPGQVVDNLTALANNQTKGLGIIGSATVDAKDFKVGVIKITSGTVPSSPSGTGSASLYLAISEDGTTFTEGLNPNSTDGPGQTNLFVSAEPGPAGLQGMLVQKIYCPASNAAYYFNAFSLLAKLGYVPTFWSVYVVNNTGAALTATPANFIAGYKQITFN